MSHAANPLLEFMKVAVGTLAATFFYYLMVAIAATLPPVIELVVIWLAASALAYLLLRVYRRQAKLYAAIVAGLLLIAQLLLFYRVMNRFGVITSKSTDFFYELLNVPGYLPGLLLQVFLPLVMVLVFGRFFKNGITPTTHLESRA